MVALELTFATRILGAHPRQLALRGSAENKSDTSDGESSNG
jgi:hypothetical protein